MKKNILLAGILTFVSSSLVMAQDAAEKSIVLLGAQKVSVNYSDTTCYIPVLTNQDLDVTTSADWIVTSYANKRLKVQVQKNLNTESRSAVISVSTKNGALSRTFVVEQAREGLGEFIPTDYKIEVSSATASSQQSSEGIERSYDGDPTTLWHSAYDNSGENYFPITITYNFKDVDQIDYLRYVPRSSGSNGNFKEVEIYVKCKGESEYKKAYSGDFEGTNSSKDVVFDEPLMNPESIRFKIISGAGDGQGFASCAEMEFYKKRGQDPNVQIFANDLWDSLADGTTQADIDALTNPYVKFVAQSLFDQKEEFTKGRIQEYVCRLSPYTQSDLWNSPGKYYDQFQGVTGININKGIHGIAVSGLPDGASVTLKVVAWFAQELDSEGVGDGPKEYSYQLHNGINSITYDSDYDGLAYISYYSDEYPVDPVTNPNIKVHFINGTVNGYLTADKTNDELYEILTKAKNRCIDLVGSKVHSVWQTASVRDYCKASDGVSRGYVQYINLLDSLVGWEHRLLGFEKYNRLPDNRTMAYVNYTYYMFQGQYGVSFMYDQEKRVLNCNTLMFNDDDAIWGLSHEWGHQHQMTPYFCWTGQSECTNNMNSCYNVLHMGYTGSHGARIQNNWNSAYEKFFTTPEATYSGEARQRAYDNSNRFSWNSAIVEELKRQKEKYTINGEYKVPSIQEDPEHALGANEVYVEEQLAPFFMLYCYFSNTEHVGYTKDFQEDLYEALRQNDEENGSSIEKKDGVDKYELLASAQNGNKNGKYEVFKNSYPESCWIKNGYVTASSVYTQNSVPFIFNYIRKASRLCGYNLFDYFDKFGFLRTIILTVDDYGLKDYAMMEDMKAEFKADMEALNLKTLTDDMIESISHSPIPTFPVPEIPNEPVQK